MKKTEKTLTPFHMACLAQQVHLVGTYNPDSVPLILTQAFVCYISGPPEGIVVSIAASDQIIENIRREQVFSLNYCKADMLRLAESAWYGYTPDQGLEQEIEFSKGHKLNVPILDASPYVIECKVTQSFQVGDTSIFISEAICIHADNRYVSPYPQSGDAYGWYESHDIEKFDPLLYSFKYYTLGQSIGQIGIKF